METKTTLPQALEGVTLAAIIVAITFMSSSAIAACKVKWVDHDYNTLTPAVRRQVCDNALDLPAINNPGIRPLQRPQIRPIEQPRIPPIGTNRCRNQSVYERGRWVTKQLCY